MHLLQSNHSFHRDHSTAVTAAVGPCFLINLATDYHLQNRWQILRRENISNKIVQLVTQHCSCKLQYVARINCLYHNKVLMHKFVAELALSTLCNNKNTTQGGNMSNICSVTCNVIMLCNKCLHFHTSRPSDICTCCNNTKTLLD